MENGSPQTENGYTRIANELLEALAKAQASGLITGKERAIVDFVIRYTYGFQQKNGYFKTDYISKELGLSKNNIRYLLFVLKKKSRGEFTGSRTYSDEWKSTN